MVMKRILAWICMLSVCTGTTQQPQFRASETVAERESRMRWWNDAKFGMFVHLGYVRRKHVTI